jgi:outer membrane protein OmpA-like peptidoglycan-associated protein
MLSRVIGAMALLATLAGCASVPNPLAGATPNPAQAAPAAAAPGASDPRIAALVRAGTKPLTGSAVSAYMDNVENTLHSQFATHGISITREGNLIVVDVPADKAFETGESTLKPASRPLLVALGVALRHFNQTVIDVYGFTDSTGTPTAQRDLSQRRAVTVGTILAAQGVGQERFYMEGKGAANPIASNATAGGRAQNRRIDIQISPVI